MTKLLLKYLIAFIILALMIALAAHLLAAGALRAFITKKLPPHTQIEIGNIETNVFTGDASLFDLELAFLDSVNGEVINHMKVDAVHISNLRYLKAAFCQTLSAQKLRVENPKLKSISRADSLSQGSNKDSNSPLVVNWLFELDEITLKGGDFIETGSGEDTTRMILGLNSTIKGFVLDSSYVKSKLPLDFEIIDSSFDTLLVCIGRFERLACGPSKLASGRLIANNFGIESILSKQELLKASAIEREHVQLHIPHIDVRGMHVDLSKALLGVTADSAHLSSVQLGVFLDKAAIARTAFRPMYSRLLRQLDLRVNISSLTMDSSSVVYEERLGDTRAVARIHFNDLSAEIEHFCNYDIHKGDTRIKVLSSFMGTSPMEFYWRYHIGNNQDAFKVAVNMQRLPMQSISPFFQAYAGASSEGFIEHLFFEIDGDNDRSTGTMKMAYDDLRFDILRKDRTNIARLKTTLGNWILANDSKKSDDGYRYGEIEVDREKNRSFFNYIWLNARDGLRSVLLGDGKVDNRKKSN